MRKIVHAMGGLNMLAMEIQEHARKLREARGDRALAEAAQKAKALEQQGQADKAQDWRRIEAALRELQGPHAS
jgi:hypothetical protein